MTDTTAFDRAITVIEETLAEPATEGICTMCKLTLNIGIAKAELVLKIAKAQRQRLLCEAEIKVLEARIQELNEQVAEEGGTSGP